MEKEPNNTLPKKPFMEKYPWFPDWFLNQIGIFFPLLASFIAAKALSTELILRVDDFFMFYYLLCTLTFADYYTYRKSGDSVQLWASRGLILFGFIFGGAYAVCKFEPKFSKPLPLLRDFTHSPLFFAILALIFFVIFSCFLEFVLHRNHQESPKMSNALHNWSNVVFWTLFQTIFCIGIGILLSLFNPSITSDLFLPKKGEAAMLTSLILFSTLSDCFKYRNERSVAHLLGYYFLLLAFAVFMMLYGIYKAQNDSKVAAFLIGAAALVIAVAAFMEHGLHPDEKGGE